MLAKYQHLRSVKSQALKIAIGVKSLHTKSSWQKRDPNVHVKIKIKINVVHTAKS